MFPRHSTGRWEMHAHPGPRAICGIDNVGSRFCPRVTLQFRRQTSVLPIRLETLCFLSQSLDLFPCIVEQQSQLRCIMLEQRITRDQVFQCLLIFGRIGGRFSSKCFRKLWSVPSNIALTSEWSMVNLSLAFAKSSWASFALASLTSSTSLLRVSNCACNSSTLASARFRRLVSSFALRLSISY